MKIPGLITVRPARFDDSSHEFSIEVHVEDEDYWYGYSMLNPNEGYQTWPKKSYLLIADQGGTHDRA
jgi:hypothetical protein